MATEVQITRDHPEYDNVTHILGDRRNEVPDERAWMVYGDTKPHLEVETFARDANGDYLINEAGDEIVINTKRTIVWLD